MAITPLPTPPSRSDPINFAARADAFLGALPLMATQMNATAGAADAAAATAINAPGTAGNSVTSLAISTGAKTFSIETGKLFKVGMFVLLASKSAPANYMNGQITAYDSGTGGMIVTVNFVKGAGTFNDWNVIMTLPVDVSGFASKAGDTFAGQIIVAPPASDGHSVYCLSLVNPGSSVGSAVVFDLAPTPAGPGLRSAQVIGYHQGGNVVDLVLATSNAGDPTPRWRVTGAGAFVPWADNVYSVGTGAYRSSTGYFASGIITTSDEREKLWRGALTDNELAAAREIAGEIGIYQWLKEFAEKGAGEARLHCGPRAQRVAARMVAHDLDPTRYGLYCVDTWPATPEVPYQPGVPAIDEVRDEDDNIIVAGSPEIPERPAMPAIPAGDRYGIRTDELLMFICAGQEQRLRLIEAHLAA